MAGLSFQATMAIPTLMVPRSSWCMDAVYMEDVKAMHGCWGGCC